MKPNPTNRRVIRMLVKDIMNDLIWRRYAGQHIVALMEGPNGFSLELEDGRLLEVSVVLRGSPKELLCESVCGEGST